MPGLGAIGVVRTGGWAARLILWATGVGPWMHRTLAGVNHVVVYVGRQTFVYRGRRYVNEPAVVEGRPGGAGLAPLSEYPDAIWTTDALPLSPANAALVVKYAMGLIGTRYGWLNCAFTGLVRLFGWHAPAVVLWVVSTQRWGDCAQIADYAWTDAADELLRTTGVDGQRLFRDGRPAGLVAPQDILEVITHRALAPALPGDAP